MDLLSFLIGKKNETTESNHPFTYYDNNFRYIYCFGLGVLACGHMKAISETQQYFNQLLDLIRLPEKERNRIIIDINNNFDYKINEVFKLLDTKEKQYVFISDLIKLSNNTLWAQLYSEKVVHCYMSVFQLSKAERDFLIEFTNLSYKKNKDEALSRYKDFARLGYMIRYSSLKYMSGDIIISETFDDLNLSNGETITIDKPTTIRGDITVEHNSTLILDGANLDIYGSILVKSGRLIIKDTKIIAVGMERRIMIYIQHSAYTRIEDSVIDCSFKCGMIHQVEGNLLINNTHISHTKGENCIIFEGRSFWMNGTTIEDALDGGIRLQYEVESFIDDCNFYNCQAEHGGGIYSNSIYDTKITNSNFYNCKAKYLGGAVYFIAKKYGQSLYGCNLEKCFPIDSVVFNDFQSENNRWGETDET